MTDRTGQFFTEVNPMLILSQKPGEPIYLTLPDGRKVVLHLLAVGGDRVRIGIEAPRDVVILRDDAKKKEGSVT